MMDNALTRRASRFSKVNFGFGGIHDIGGRVDSGTSCVAHDDFHAALQL